MLKQSVMMHMKSNHQKLSQAPPDLDMFPMVEIGDFKIVDVEMQTMNDGDILIACNIIRYMGWR
jgi:hypothetical protein